VCAGLERRSSQLKKPAHNPKDTEDTEELLEREFLWLLKSELDELLVTPNERKEMAGKVIAIARRKALNQTRTSITDAFRRQIELERAALKRISDEVDELIDLDERKFLSLLRADFDAIHFNIDVQQKIARDDVASARKLAAKTPGLSLRRAFEKQVGSRTENDRRVEAEAGHNFSANPKLRRRGARQPRKTGRRRGSRPPISE
jgi:hypothetical protein